MLNYLRHIKHGIKRWISSRLIHWAERKVYKATNGVVLQGPFRGLKLVNENVFGSEIPKLLGSYEKELNAPLTAALNRSPNTICNLGAAEGYYALGCAKYKSVNHVIVFEALESGRRLITENLSANDIHSNVEVRGLCHEEVLWETLNSSKIDLMLIDIEGAELDILSTRNIELLSNTELIIESHDFCQPDCMSHLQNSLKVTHDLEVIDSTPRCISDFPDVIFLPASLKLELMNERRPGIMQWLVCCPKTNH